MWSTALSGSKRLLFILTGLSLLLCAIGLSIISTTFGSRYLVSYLIDHHTSPNQLTIETIDGTILYGMRLNKLSYQNTTFDLHIGTLQLRWNPLKLLSGYITLASLHASNIEYRSRSNISSKKDHTDASSLVNFPLAFEIKQAVLEGIVLHQNESVEKIEKIEFHAKLDSNLIAVNNLKINYSNFEVLLQGNLENSSPHAINAHAKWRYTAVNKENAAGQLKLSGHLKSIKINHTLQTPFTLSSEGEISFENEPVIHLKNTLNEAQWQSKNAQATVQINQATMILDGWLNAFTLNAECEISDARSLYANLNIEAHGNTDAFQISKFNLASSDKKILGQGTADIRINPHRSLKTDLKLSLINNQISVHGHINDTVNLNWKLNAQALGDLFADMDGVVISEGSISGKHSNPIVKGVASAHRIKYKDASIKNASLKALSTPASNNIALQIHDLSVGQQHFNKIETTLQGNINEHTISTKLQHSLGKLLFNLKGSYQKSLWHGQLTHAKLTSQPLSDWELAQASNLQISSKAIKADDHCWQHKASRLCGKISLTAENHIEAESELQNLPLSILNSHFINGHQLEGYVNGTASLIGHIDSFIGNLQLNLPTGAVLIKQQNENNLFSRHPWKDMSLKLTGQRDSDWVISSTANFLQNGKLSSNIQVDKKQNLNGHLSANMENIAWLEILLPQLSNTGGSINAHLALSGTAQKPTTQLTATLQNAHTNIDTLGVNLTSINMQASTVTPENIKLEGSMKSGQGEMHVHGNLIGDLINKWQLSLTTRGDDFEILNLSEARASINPDIIWSIDNKQLDMQGKIHIAKADINIKTLPPDAVDISTDTVILKSNKKSIRNTPYIISNKINIELGDDVHFQGLGFNSALYGQLIIQEKAGQLTQAFGELLLKKGFYKAYGQKLLIEDGSKLIFQGPYDNPNLSIRSVRKTTDVTVGIEINGTLKAPKSRLFSTPSLPDTEIIAILLTGKPLSSASKTDASTIVNAIATLGIERGAGISKRISETFKLDVLTVDSHENLNQSSLLLGKYLTPKLFVRYAIGLFDQSNSLGLEYQLNKKLKLEAQSGTQQSIDLIYKLER